MTIAKDTQLSKELEVLGDDPWVKSTEDRFSKFTDRQWDELGNEKPIPRITPESERRAFESMMHRGVSPDELADENDRKEYIQYLSSDVGKAAALTRAKYLQSLNQ